LRFKLCKLHNKATGKRAPVVLLLQCGLLVDAACSAYSRKLGIRTKKWHQEQWLVYDRKELVYMKISLKLGETKKNNNNLCILYMHNFIN
jgi:hypothetical protein